jgi:hypothetical protein
MLSSSLPPPSLSLLKPPFLSPPGKGGEKREGRGESKEEKREKGCAPLVWQPGV